MCPAYPPKARPRRRCRWLRGRSAGQPESGGPTVPTPCAPREPQPGSAPCRHRQGEASANERFRLGNRAPCPATWGRIGDAKELVPGRLASLVHRLGEIKQRVPIPVITPPVPIQFIHQDDVGQAFLLCIVGMGPWHVQHHRRWRAERSAASPRARLCAHPGPGTAAPDRRTWRCGSALRTSIRRLDGGDHSPGDHRRRQSQAEQPRGAARQAGRSRIRAWRIVMGRLRGSASAEIDASLLESGLWSRT
jgi:hypothetical protein